MRRRLLILAILLLAGPQLYAQGFCDNFTYPFQRKDRSGTMLGDTRVTLPAEAKGAYPVDIFVPPNVLRFSMVSWFHAFPDGYPANTLFMAGSIEKLPLVDKRATHEMKFLHIEGNAFSGNLPVTKNVSLPLFAGDHYAVRVWSENGAEVTAWLAIGVQACFATRQELDLFREGQAQTGKR